MAGHWPGRRKRFKLHPKQFGGKRQRRLRTALDCMPGRHRGLNAGQRLLRWHAALQETKAFFAAHPMLSQF